MSARRVGRGRCWTRTGTAVVLALLVAGCGSGDDGGGEDAAICRVLSPAVLAARPPGDATFTSLLTSRPTIASEGFVGGVTYGRTAVEGADLGPYRAAIDFLVERSLAADPEFADDHPEPKLTTAVEASAERLDRDLAEGRCG